MKTWMRRKCLSSFTSRYEPSIFQLKNVIFLSWIDRDTANIMIAQTHDLINLDHKIKLRSLSITPTALATGPSGLLIAGVDPQTQQICLEQSPNGLYWGSKTQLKMRTVSAPGLAYFGEHFWLLWRNYNDNRLHLIRSNDGLVWRDEEIFEAQTDASPSIVVYQERLTVTWRSQRDGSIYLDSVEQGLLHPNLVHRKALTEHNLYVHGDQLFMTWMDPTTGQILVMLKPKDREWLSCATLHERCIGAPNLTSLGKRLALAWVRDDSHGNIHFALVEDSVSGENRRVFSGDVQGHPTALDLYHHTPYPYLGIVVLPADMDLPQGQTEANLTAGLDAALAQGKAFWVEASYGNVDITYQVHPQVVKLPKPMKDYIIRNRPKLIDGYGATFPVTFQGGETLELEGSNNFQVTVTFSQGTIALQDVIDKINQSIDATAFNGPAEEKPAAYQSDIGQLRIHTTGFVDPGTVLNIKGGTALDLLGLGQDVISVYEGSKTQTDNLQLMLCDALRAAANAKPDPAGFLNQFYGVVITLASNLGWYAIRANAQPPREDLPILENQKTSPLAFYFTTSIDSPNVHAHETGHTLWLPDLYEDEIRNRWQGTEPEFWDMMADSTFSHPTAWMKSYASNPKAPESRWMGEKTIAVLDGDKQSVEVLLMPNESSFPGNNPFAASHPGIPICHAIKIELHENLAFYVENRQKGPYTHPDFGTVTYSSFLPGNGLLITEAVNDRDIVNQPRSNVILAQPLDLKVADIPDSIIDEVLAAANQADKQFILAPYVPAEIPQGVADKIAEAKDRKEIERIIRKYQENQIRGFYPVYSQGEEVVLYQFPDGQGDIRVKLLEAIGTARPYVYKVKATWGRPGKWFDLKIRKWQNAPPYETPDIWIDSEENGWNTYEHHDAVLNPDVTGNPVLNGDRPWVGHENRVYARVWNNGDIPQNNVRVDFEYMPPGQSLGYRFDTDTINIPAGGWALAIGRWTPLNVPADEHACIVASIEYRPWDLDAKVIGELSADNNSAQENITDFYIEQGSPYQDITIPFEFANPLSERAEMKIVAQGLRPGWTLTVEPYRFSLEPGERMEGEAILHANESVPLEDPTEGYPAPIISLQALVQTRCTWEPIGGFSMIAHTVRKSKLDVGIDPTATGVHVSAYASTQDGPVANANIAARLIGPARETLKVTRAMTDGQGHAHLFLPVAWEHYPPNSPFSVETRLSPSKKTGPTSVITPVPR
jgi:hypothetical protein